MNLAIVVYGLIGLLLLLGLLYFNILGQDTTTNYIASIGAAAIYLYFAYWRWSQRVKTFRFYEGFFELSGRKFSQRFGYEDVSRLSLTRTTFGGFSEDVIAFTVKDELAIFRFKNPVNKNLNADLYSWMAKKVSHSAMTKPIESSFWTRYPLFGKSQPAG